MFLGLLDPDPLVGCMDPDFSIFFHKGVERSEIMLVKQLDIFKVGTLVD
jgi:hypothetical protein